jgi:RNA polymerase sigma factor (sigma-70 family)
MVVEDEDNRRVIAGLRDLAPRQRDCLVLRFYYEMTERETADALAISPSSVKTHCRRGLATLGQRLGER